jgi:rhamnose utilization protein RhaD (predicted bifunctional aldolase and dehydrogenase)/NAD(P)-dependent dehydrogenase (short-subunit alcohol dehydrogenase family)
LANDNTTDGRPPVKSRWTELDAQAFVDRYAARGVNEDLALRTYSSRLLGSDPQLVLHGGGNTSVKTTLTDTFGNPVAALCVKGSGWDLATIEPEGHSALRLEPLLQLRAARLSDEALVNYFRQNLLDTTAPNPSVETLTHAYAPHKFVDHTHAVIATAIGSQPDPAAVCRAIYGDRVAPMRYVMPGFDLSLATAEMFERFPDAEGMLLANHGIFTYAGTARASYELMIEFVTMAEDYIAANGRRSAAFAAGGAVRPPRPTAADVLPRIRGAFAAAAPAQSRYWIFDVRSNARIAAFVDGPGLDDYALRGVATPEHVIRMKRLPLLLGEPDVDIDAWSNRMRAALEAYIADYHAYFVQNNARVGGNRRELDPLPRVIVLPGIGVVGTGRDAAEAAISADVAEAWVDAISAAESIGHYVSIDVAQHFDMEYWSLEQVKLGNTVRKPLAGRVVVLTGGGSGIGAATARAFAAEGAAVAVVDLDGASADTVAHGIKGAFARACDVTDPQAVRAAFDAIITHFGGVDIVVSNAGAAWTGMMAEIDDAVLRKSFELNFFAHHYVASNAVRIMRQQRTGGVILFNVSKQAVNPGPNFGAYGTSKAALLALVRQYALEHGADGIRCNAINADRIRSGLLNDAFIAERARARGVSERDYMAGNLLGQEVFADDVARAFVSSALLEKSTGNITTVDGGNVAAMLR